jgi:catechol 2,3-dioxygenase-like lactoylglutathione lyase family enzyme
MIEGIDSITYSTDQWNEARQFLNDWGLLELGVSDTLQRFETLNGAQVLVRRPDDASLPPAMESGPTLREVVWGVEQDADLDLLVKSCTSPMTESVSSYENNSKYTPDGALTTPRSIITLDPHGLRLVFQRSAKRPIRLQGAASNPYGKPQRIDAPSPVYERAQPIEIGHVVLFTNQLAQAVDFYEKLGFVLSDSYPGRGAFLRCAPTGGHHDVFLLQVPGKATGLNHVAFTVRDIHEVFGGGLAMGRAGWKTQLGPGRHPVSSAYFWYFNNPCGGLIEYNADEDHLTPAWQPREFTPGPTMFAEWAIDGGIDGHTRRQPHVQASGAFLTEKKP